MNLRSSCSWCDLLCYAFSGEARLRCQQPKPWRIERCSPGIITTDLETRGIKNEEFSIWARVIARNGNLSSNKRKLGMSSGYVLFGSTQEYKPGNRPVENLSNNKAAHKFGTWRGFTVFIWEAATMTGKLESDLRTALKRRKAEAATKGCA